MSTLITKGQNLSKCTFSGSTHAFAEENESNGALKFTEAEKKYLSYKRKRAQKLWALVSISFTSLISCMHKACLFFVIVLIQDNVIEII